MPTHLTGINDTEGALRTLRRTLDNVLCVTLGEHGAMALDGDRFYHEPAFKVHARGHDRRRRRLPRRLHLRAAARPADRQVLRIANAAAAVSCTRLGALDGVPTLEEVDASCSAAERRAR